jgi:phage gpG-like protein
MKNFQQLHQDLVKASNQMEAFIAEELPTIAAVEWLKLTQRNFDNEGWTEGGATEKWKARTTTWQTNKVLTKRALLRNSIRARSEEGKVVIGIDISTIPYAQIHNEGGEIAVTPKMRKYFLAMFMKLRSTAGTQEALFWLHMSRAKKIVIPKRPYLGFNKDLIQILSEIITEQFNELLNND